MKLPTTPQHGINVPLFSIRSQSSCGIGEYLDLIPLIHWCKDVGFNILQTLPLNDTGTETSPYCALTATALNPIHLSLSQLPGIENYRHLKDHLTRFQGLNALPYVDYQTVLEGKIPFLQEYYRVSKAEIFQSEDFQTFYRSSSWLKGYALFKTLKECSRWQPWSEWDPDIRDCNPEALKKLETKFETEIDFHIFVQFLCFHQMAQVKAAAEAVGISMMGDVPILINRESADVWLYRQYFTLSYSAGAPPDQYAQRGQDWGFPIYNWEALTADQYQWWRQRLETASRLYHLYRLDHIVGFFRIWAIPENTKASEGGFIPQDPALWVAHGDEILKMMLESSPMIPIGEDLGTVPDEVRAYLKEHSICGTRVMRWERYWHGDRSYIPIQNYIPLSLTTVSTHDSELLTEWWRNQPEEAGTYAANQGWPYSATLTQEQRKNILRDSHRSRSLYHINLINEYLDGVPELSWKLPGAERINIPGTVSPENWTLKLSPTVEEIASNPSLKQYIQTLLTVLLLFICPRLDAETDAHIKMLYSGLEPSSISQHLAFYRLYADTPYGQMALNDSWKLLGRGIVNDGYQNSTEMLSHFPGLTGALVALINQKENETVLLSESEIAFIDRMATFLPNRKLKGSRAQVPEEVVKLPPEEVDLARGLFLTLLDQTPQGWQQMRSYEALLDLMALQVMARIPMNATPKDKIKAMNELIFFELGYRFPPQSLSTTEVDVYTFLPTVLNSRKGVCLGVSILYLCLAQRLNLPLEMITPPGHIYVRYNDGGDEINIETTCRGVHIDSEHYLSLDTCDLEQQNIKQVIALAYINQAAVYLGTGKFDLAETAYKKALVYHPDHDVLHRFLGLALCMNGKVEEGKAHLEKSRTSFCKHQVSQDTLAEDYLNGHIDAGGIARFVKHVEENRTAILEEKIAYEKILEDFPKFRLGWLGLAGTCLELGNERQALKALETYHQIDPNNATVEFYLANLYAKRFDFEKGWQSLSRCEAITQARDYFPRALRDFRKQLQQLSPE